MKKRIIFTSVFAFIVLLVSAQTQSIANLRAEQNKTKERLKITNKLLEENKKNTSSTLNRASLLEAQITDRQLLISQINEEIKLINSNIKNQEKEIAGKEREMEQLKEEYAQLMYHAYLRRSSYDKLMFVLSAESFSQSYRRLRYLQEITDYRKTQAKQIADKTEALNKQLAVLAQEKKDKESILKERENENTQLQGERKNMQELLTDLKKKEKKLLEQIKKEQKQINDLNDKINKLIAQATENEKAKGFALTKEEQLIAGNFEKNKGKLPWPVERGRITGKFGQHPHPVLSGVIINNRGVYIQTEKGSNARSIFEGVVTQRFSMPGNNNAVIIRHGNYRTVYSNLTEIYVKEGDKVTTKQNIGKIFTDAEDGNKTVIYFMIYKDKDIQNPELFLTK